ncbi:hypothetical protein N561_01960 [Gallibacterium anatis 12656/12]|uniref:Uncharacterized protein n=1 Tax=Gallibacterium anatis 12656/12 TaxID=1195244 RepID=U1H4A8_9PAST|nr:hypothetical protein N561_01960 [Gallibacterium anatis 12656/12]
MSKFLWQIYSKMSDMSQNKRLLKRLMRKFFLKREIFCVKEKTLVFKLLNTRVLMTV